MSDEPSGPAIPWAAIPFFRGLRSTERDALRPILRMKAYEEGETVFREGDPALTFHFVVGGKIKIVKTAPDGRDVILEVLGPGDPVGAVAAYEERPFPASAITLEATTLLSAPRDELFALMAVNPALVRGLLLGLTSRLMEMTRKMAERGSRVEYRMARLFLALAERLGRERGDHLEIPLVLSRQEIADMVGTTQETAIRVMSRWAKENLVSTTDTGFRVANRRGLEAIPPGD